MYDLEQKTDSEVKAPLEQKSDSEVNAPLEQKSDSEVNAQTEYSFYAMLDRMQYINRWGLMRNNRTENIKEHSMDVAIVAHALALIRMHVCPEGRPEVDPLYVMGLAMFHDASEIITGDLPTPIKYHNPEITKAYKQIEGQATDTLLSHLPEMMREEYRSLFCPDRTDPMKEEAYHLVKAADRICAYIKCISEENSGNREFASAKQGVLAAIAKMSDPEVVYFMEHFSKAYGMTLDQISE